MRAGDDDRQRVADRLKTALDEGRIDLHEYDERLQQAYAARTYGELNGLLDDLPAPDAGTAAAAKARNPTLQWLVAVWASWVTVVGICVAIWAVSGIANGDAFNSYFWPIWVAGPWGAIVVMHTIAGLASGAPQKLAAKQAEEAERKRRKREKKQAYREKAERDAELHLNAALDQSRAQLSAEPQHETEVVPLDTPEPLRETRPATKRAGEQPEAGR